VSIFFQLNCHFWGASAAAAGAPPREPLRAAVTFRPPECIGFSGAPTLSRSPLALSLLVRTGPRAIFGVDAPQIKKFSVQKVSSVRARRPEAAAAPDSKLKLLCLHRTRSHALSHY